MSAVDMAEIVDASRVAARMADPRPASPRGYLLSFFPEARIPPIGRRDRRARPLAARVNHGVWIVACPCEQPGLPSPGMALWPSIPWMWCVRCRNHETRGKWRPVAVPPAEVRARIEAILLCRPGVSDRNWEPDETIAELIRQNVEHGDPVPEGIADGVRHAS